MSDRPTCSCACCQAPQRDGEEVWHLPWCTDQRWLIVTSAPRSTSPQPKEPK